MPNPEIEKLYFDDTAPKIVKGQIGSVSRAWYDLTRLWRGREKVILINAKIWAEEQQWVAVQSSNVDSIMYNKYKLELYVRMDHGKTYCYQGVPKAIAINMFNASSMGKYVHQVLKRNYEFK